MSTETERQASEYERLAEQEPDRRVQHLCDAAEHWHDSGAPERARELFERALATDGHAVRDERVGYARFLFDTGEPERARHTLDELWRSRDLTGSAYYDAGTLADDRFDDQTAALRWYTSGIVRLAGPDATSSSDNDVWIELLIGARRAVRGRLGEPADEWDELWDTSMRAKHDNTGDSAGQAAAPEVLAFVYWTPDELAEYLRRWPGGYPEFDGVDDPHTEHRRQLEATLREYSGAAVITRPSVAGFAEYARAEEVSPSEPATRAAYGTVAARENGFVPWPPERNDPCWCGSGAKYKKCCARPGFV